jgi:hypothetical protein
MRAEEWIVRWTLLGKPNKLPRTLLETMPMEAWDTPAADGFLPGEFFYEDDSIFLELSDMRRSVYARAPFYVEIQRRPLTDPRETSPPPGQPRPFPGSGRHGPIQFHIVHLQGHEGVQNAIKAALRHDWDWFK